MKKSKSGLVFNILAYGFLAVALFVAFKPYMDFNNPNLAEIKKVEAATMVVSPGSIPVMLQGKDKPVMLVLYASWCPICNSVMPLLENAMRDESLYNIYPLFISLDEQPRLFAKYIHSHGYQQLFVPMRADEGLTGSVAGALAKTGSRYNGAIPYVGFFDKNGKVIVDFSGDFDKEFLRKTIANLPRQE